MDERPRAPPMPRLQIARRKAVGGRARTAHFCGDAELAQRDFDLTSGPRGPAGFQRQDGIRRRSLGKGRRVRSVIPAWRGQRTATNQNGCRLSWTAWGALSPRATVAVHRKRNTCIGGFSSARVLAATAPLHECRGLAEAVQELRAKRRAGNDALVERAVCDSLIHEPLAFEISAAAPAELELAPPDAADAIRHSWSCSPPNSKYGHPSATRIALVVRVADHYSSQVRKEDGAFSGQPISYQWTYCLHQFHWCIAAPYRLAITISTLVLTRGDAVAK